MPEPISRRTALGGAAALATLLGLGVPLLRPAVALGAPTTTAADTAALATSLVGKTLYQLQSSPMTDAPWSTYAYEWCAVFTSWLLRGVTGDTYLTFASDQYYAFSSVSTPAVGDIIYYSDPGHVGIVVSTDGGVRTVEGNVPGVHWSLSTVKTYSPPWQGGYQFSRPPYGSQSSSGALDDMPFLIYNSGAFGTRRAYYVPGRPMKVLTTADAVTMSAIIKQFRELPSTAADGSVTANLTDTQWALIETIEGPSV